MSWSHMCQAICDQCNDSSATHHYTTEAQIRDTLQLAGWIVTYQVDRITRMVCPYCASSEEE